MTLVMLTKDVYNPHRTIALQPPENADPVDYATAVILDTAALLFLRRPAQPACPPDTAEVEYRCDTGPGDPLCIPCAVRFGTIYLAMFRRVSYKHGPLWMAGQLAQASARHTFEDLPAEAHTAEEIRVRLTGKAREWARSATAKTTT